ncbi:MAG: hypothetical protein OM95_07100 [Bdellovibrio sp. ArHS]|uniref:response regulator transcription factor n=1 Tax=Bdellovibrio sp. ArHS TaxID=1569284 RepID=UPI0005835541|nr:response regulator transcription factor [Bdellovibrio sp. ArHS]KHD88876.1 MAG: hypothetical protein OM95_07100 [Bdellovibrio sp. ArHS]
MAKILLIEDNLTNQLVVKETLSTHDVICANTLKEATLHITSPFDLVILDVQLPDGSGFDFYMHHHAQLQDIPVIILTVHGEVHDKVIGFSLGAEDYVTKPFEPVEFRARIEAKLRKKNKHNESAVLKIDGLHFDLTMQKISCETPDLTKNLDTTSIEFKILLYLAKHRDTVITRQQLLDQVWGGSTTVVDRAIDTHMSKLRKKLDGTPWEIKSVYGSGYRFEKQS